MFTFSIKMKNTSVLSNGTNTRHGSYTQILQASFLSVGTLDLLLVPPMFILNILFIWLIKKHPTLQSNPNKLLTLLALTDLFNCSVSQVCFAVECILLSRGLFYLNFDKIVACTAYSVTGASFFIVILISVERYIAIVFPFYYNMKFRLSYLVILYVILVLSWLTTVVITLTVWHMMAFYIIAAVIIAFGCGVIFICYVGIFCVYRRTQKNIKLPCGNYDVKIKVKNHRTAFIAGLVVMTLVVCYAPFLILSVLMWRQVAMKIWLILPWTQTVALLPGLINPIIYYWRLKGVRAKFLRLWSNLQPFHRSRERCRPFYLPSRNQINLQLNKLEEKNSECKI